MAALVGAARRHRPEPPGLITATLWHGNGPIDSQTVGDVSEHVRSALVAAGGELIGCLQTAYVDNEFPALPVRTGEHVLVHVARFADVAAYRDVSMPPLASWLAGPPQVLRLAPTARSRLR